MFEPDLRTPNWGVTLAIALAAALITVALLLIAQWAA